MQPGFGTVLTIVATVAGVVATLVAPMYYLVLDMRRSGGEAEVKRETLADSQDDLEDDLESLEESIEDARQDIRGDMTDIKQQVAQNAVRSEQNQRHIHQLIVGRESEREDEIGNPHHTAENCPLPEECPFHSPEPAE